MSFENPKLEQQPTVPETPAEKEPEIEEKGEKEKMEYDPVISVRRDFSPEWVYRDEETAKAEIDDPDLKQIMNFYRKETKEGTLLDLGAGPTHLHYMSVMEDKLSHITALDLSEKNLKALEEFLDGVSPEKENKKTEKKYTNDEDLDTLKIIAEAREGMVHRKNPRTGEGVLSSIRDKSIIEGKYDFIAGNMHDLSKLEQRKFDNIMMGFSLYANKEEEIPELLKQVKERLNPGGKVVIADFKGFSAENLKDEEFAEDEKVMKQYPNPIDYSLPFLIASLEKAGFSKDAIKARMTDTHSEGEKDFKYLFVSASQEGPKTKAEVRKAAQAEKREQKKEWKEHFGSLAEIELAREKAERQAKKEKAVIETAKPPEKGMEPKQILKEVGIQKPAESFKETQERLAERLGNARTYTGEKLSLAETNEMTRNFYLGELGYSVRYRGLLHGKAELLDEKGEAVTDNKGKALEFKTFWSLNRREMPMTDFLKNELKKKLEAKPGKAMAGEKKIEAGFQKTVKTAEQEQGRREEKISFLSKIKNLGKSSLEKLAAGMSRLAGLEQSGILGLQAGGKFAVKAGRELAAFGLSPLAAAEDAGRYVAGKVQTEKALKESMLARENIKTLKEVPAARRPEYFYDLLESLKVDSKISHAELMRGYDKIYNKGKILGLIDKLRG